MAVTFYGRKDAALNFNVFVLNTNEAFQGKKRFGTAALSWADCHILVFVGHLKKNTKKKQLSY